MSLFCFSFSWLIIRWGNFEVSFCEFFIYITDCFIDSAMHSLHINRKLFYIISILVLFISFYICTSCLHVCVCIRVCMVCMSVCTCGGQRRTLCVSTGILLCFRWGLLLAVVPARLVNLQAFSCVCLPFCYRSAHLQSHNHDHALLYMHFKIKLMISFLYGKPFTQWPSFQSLSYFYIIYVYPTRINVYCLYNTHRNIIFSSAFVHSHLSDPRFSFNFNSHCCPNLSFTSLGSP